jgi:hypothetical protein
MRTEMPSTARFNKADALMLKKTRVAFSIIGHKVTIRLDTSPLPFANIAIPDAPSNVNPQTAYIKPTFRVPFRV